MLISFTLLKVFLSRPLHANLPSFGGNELNIPCPYISIEEFILVGKYFWICYDFYISLYYSVMRNSNICEVVSDMHDSGVYCGPI